VDRRTRPHSGATRSRLIRQVRRALIWWRENRPAAPALLEQELLSVLEESYFFSSAASLRARSVCVESSSRSLTTVRMISIFTAMARGLCRTLESIATPCSVKAYGAYRRPPWAELEVPVWYLKLVTSSAVS
jgi:hypothetical protein